MNSKLSRLLVLLYPRPWRDRYGAEFDEFLQSGAGDWRVSFNVLFAAVAERILPTVGGKMSQPTQSFATMTKLPSAFIPVAMSFTALLVIAIGPFLFGDLHSKDEGPTAHLWQILMAGQIPVVLFFAIKWLRRAPRQTLKVLALQAGGVLANVAVVFFLGVG